MGAGGGRMFQWFLKLMARSGKGVDVARGMVHRVGCVSFLNSKPLIEPLVGRAGVEVHFAVPSKLLGLVEGGVVSTGLMSIVDYQLSTVPLVLVPVGAIGCDGPTLTVRIFSKVPPGKIVRVHGDTDSHTSVVLAQVILRERYGRGVEMVGLEAQSAKRKTQNRGGETRNAKREMRNGEGAETMLLIGDKVVNAAPDEREYPYQLDLGEEWKALTGLPFVFAMWMMRADEVDRELAWMLGEARRSAKGMIEEMLDRHCAEKGWPRELARRYFTEYLRYEVTGRSRLGVAKFFELAGKWGLLKVVRDVRYLEVGGE
jgi:chorismate dehydratase